jgi:hypothetical protein
VLFLPSCQMFVLGRRVVVRREPESDDQVHTQLKSGQGQAPGEKRRRRRGRATVAAAAVEHSRSVHSRRIREGEAAAQSASPITQQQLSSAPLHAAIFNSVLPTQHKRTPAVVLGRRNNSRMLALHTAETRTAAHSLKHHSV